MKRTIRIILVVSLLAHLNGCYSYQYVSSSQLKNDVRYSYEITTYDGQVYKLIKDQFKVENDTIYFIDGPVYFNPYYESQIALSNVDQIEKKEFSLTNTIILVTIITVAVGVGIFLESAQPCFSCN